MSARKNAVATAKFQKILAQLGFESKVKASSIKAWPKGGSSKRSVDINTSKKGNTVEVLLVGFEAKEGVVSHPKPPAKTVTQMIDFSQDEKLILRAFFKACKSLTAAASAPAPTPTKEEIMNDSPAASSPEAPAEQPVAETVAA